MNGSLLVALEAKIAEIQSTLTQAEATGWKWNEAQTESVIIDPLLSVLGYGPLEAHKQGHDAVTKGIPDYTLLPNSQQKWFLEVKKLDFSLKDGEAFQAVSYAVAQGAEWAVLTNGRTWHFYNAHYPKPLAEKRVFQIGDLFRESASVVLLSRLSRQSMLDQELTQAWAASRIADIVRQQLQTPNSATRKALTNVASDVLHAQITDGLLGGVIDEILFPKVVVPAGPPKATAAVSDSSFMSQTVHASKQTSSPSSSQIAAVAPSVSAKAGMAAEAGMATDDLAEAVFAARRAALPEEKILEKNALADRTLRTITPRLLDQIESDLQGRAYNTGIPALASLGDFRVPVRIIGREARPDPRIAPTQPTYQDTYDGIVFIEKATGAKNYHKTSRRTLMIAASLAEKYEADMPTKVSRPKAQVTKAQSGEE